MHKFVQTQCKSTTIDKRLDILTSNAFSPTSHSSTIYLIYYLSHSSTYYSRWSANSSTTNKSTFPLPPPPTLTNAPRLLRKVDFITYKSDNNHRAATVSRRYAVQNPNDYTKYNRLCGSLRQLAHLLANLQPTDPIRLKHEKLMLQKLYDLGILSQGTKMSEVERKVGVSRFCRRRLGVVMTRLRMSETVQGVYTTFSLPIKRNSSLILCARAEIFSHAPRQSNSSNKATFAWGPKSSPTLHTSSRGTWRISSPGWTAAR